jgi:hypothetical protein
LYFCVTAFTGTGNSRDCFGPIFNLAMTIMNGFRLAVAPRPE